jgi:hypothetical protein
MNRVTLKIYYLKSKFINSNCLFCQIYYIIKNVDGQKDIDQLLLKEQKLKGIRVISASLLTELLQKNKFSVFRKVTPFKTFPKGDRHD